MAVHLPETGELECDGCMITVDVDLAHFAGDPESVGFDESSNMPEGWTAEEGEHYCEECSESRR